ncbi:Cl- channel voltage-gated family protein [Hippea maritima DSM 10411]|uniref:Cl-channel voltage-gated family protein n=2 Tax=Hippea TaxID=84404 RepID=F2LUW9_HIPMA|nr:Cl- channel voltage-gated family protein [Hippea maritima DSM 10411]
MSRIKPKDAIENCKESIKCTHFNWIEIAAYILKWIPFSAICGIIVGLIASLFDYFVLLINTTIPNKPLFVATFAVLVAMITGLYIKNDATIAGPGINYVLNHMEKPVSFKSLIKKFIISVLALSGVFTAGREGPSFFIGSSISLYLSKTIKLKEGYSRKIALIGAGAFTSALLKAPLGGAIFALEIAYVSDMEYESFPQVLIASVFSYLVFSFLRGKHSLMNLSGVSTAWSIHSIPMLMLLGLVIALATYIFISSFHFANCISSFIAPVFRPIVGVILALPLLVILLSHDKLDLLNASVNYQALTNISVIHLSIYQSLKYLLLMMSIIPLTIGFGISGGLILPSLIMGAILGNLFGGLFNENIVLFSLSGMAAFLAATAKTPLAAIVLVLEISQTDLIIPLTASVIVSYIFSYGVNAYTSQQECKLNLPIQ